MNLPEQAELLVNSAHGVYIPQILAETWPECLRDAEPEDLDTLTDGPNVGVLYWEAYEAVLDCTFVKDGKEYYLWTDEDLWIIPMGIEVEE